MNILGLLGACLLSSVSALGVPNRSPQIIRGFDDDLKSYSITFNDCVMVGNEMTAQGLTNFWSGSTTDLCRVSVYGANYLNTDSYFHVDLRNTSNFIPYILDFDDFDYSFDFIYVTKFQLHKSSTAFSSLTLEFTEWFLYLGVPSPYENSVLILDTQSDIYYGNHMNVFSAVNREIMFVYATNNESYLQSFNSTVLNNDDYFYEILLDNPVTHSSLRSESINIDYSNYPVDVDYSYGAYFYGRKSYVDATSITDLLSFVNHKYSVSISTHPYSLNSYDDTDKAFTDGYNQGYDDGFDSGYYEGNENGRDSGYELGYEEGYDVGHNAGYHEGVEASNQYTFWSLFGAVADTPVLIIRNLFNFDFFGVNLMTVVLSLFTALIVFYLLRKLL